MGKQNKNDINAKVALILKRLDSFSVQSVITLHFNTTIICTTANLHTLKNVSYNLFLCKTSRADTGRAFLVSFSFPEKLLDTIHLFIVIYLFLVVCFLKKISWAFLKVWRHFHLSREEQTKQRTPSFALTSSTHTIISVLFRASFLCTAI